MGKKRKTTGGYDPLDEETHMESKSAVLDRNREIDAEENRQEVEQERDGAENHFFI